MTLWSLAGNGPKATSIVFVVRSSPDGTGQPAGYFSFAVKVRVPGSTWAGSSLNRNVVSIRVGSATVVPIVRVRPFTGCRVRAGSGALEAVVPVTVTLVPPTVNVAATPAAARVPPTRAYTRTW